MPASTVQLLSTLLDFWCLPCSWVCLGRKRSGTFYHMRTIENLSTFPLGCFGQYDRQRHLNKHVLSKVSLWRQRHCTLQNFLRKDICIIKLQCCNLPSGSYPKSLRPGLSGSWVVKSWMLCSHQGELDEPGGFQMQIQSEWQADFASLRRLGKQWEGIPNERMYRWVLAGIRKSLKAFGLCVLTSLKRANCFDVILINKRKKNNMVQ